MRRFTLFAAALLCGLLVAPPATASTPSTHDRADAAAGWLARQLVDGERFESEYGGVKYPDQGLTVDAVLAFAAARTADDNLDRAVAWLARPDITAGYVGSDGESYAGGHAKLLLAAEVAGRDPASFGGVDLRASLLALLTPSGRFSDVSAYGDYSNAFTQSLALLALDRAPSGAPASAVAFLAGTQCADGGYPIFFGVTPCVSDVDATALATQALQATGKPLKAWQGLTWLVGVQHPDGGFGAGTSNANSTGLAGQALLAGGRVGPALKARALLKNLQVGCAGAVADRGAIAYQATGFDPATATRATTQGVLGLAGVGLAQVHSGGQNAAPVLAC
ncbi:prenyltransferase/squalene oxidase repeat-containing protein [Actinosynnema sp. NPDC020468]|uniref:prenyltransferase/squalene oxidase repeat-containing protein n=1 Tax=Actinosynnema sp. NPDC020468 TaxID=3154488 RepID=UPI0034021B3D